jgi:demethylmenaquinone methyltransferase/2-methoxy-6-polyprenyl-1,4-benzoquinol methylase
LKTKKQGSHDYTSHQLLSRYDLMNDLMSGGLHRIWKAYTVAVADLRGGETVLDIAAGTGDLTKAFARKVGPSGAWCCTPTSTRPCCARAATACSTPACSPPACWPTPRSCPSPTSSFDLVSVAFGLRNMTHKDQALREMHRVLKPGGRLLVLEFSKVVEPLQKPYDWYSFKVLPRIGQWVAGDAESYRYLAESIRMHPDAPTLKAMMKDAGFGHVDVHRMTGGVVALHRLGQAGLHQPGPAAE